MSDEYDDPPGVRTVKIGEIARKTSLPTSTIWGLVDQGIFPLPINFTPGRSCWLLHEVDEWIITRCAEPRRSPFRTTDRRKARSKPAASGRVIPFRARQGRAEDEPKPAA